MVMSRETIIGLVVVPIGLAISFMLLVTYHMTRHIMCKILGCFWKKKKCMCCKHESCRKRQSDVDYGIGDNQTFPIEDSSAALPKSIEEQEEEALTEKGKHKEEQPSSERTDENFLFEDFKQIDSL